MRGLQRELRRGDPGGAGADGHRERRGNRDAIGETATVSMLERRQAPWPMVARPRFRLLVLRVLLLQV